jgi:hypothetical protein
MLDRINELIEMFLVGLGQALSRLSKEETRMITLLLSFLVLAAVAGRILQIACLGR